MLRSEAVTKHLHFHPLHAQSSNLREDFVAIDQPNIQVPGTARPCHEPWFQEHQCDSIRFSIVS